MCLTQVKVTYDQPSGLIVDAWKVFYGTPAQPAFSSFSLGGKSAVPLDRWLKAEGITDIRADDGKTYAPGFHAYSDERKDTRRVYLRGIACVGVQGGWKTMIAQEMYVPSDPDAWPPPVPETKKQLKDRIKKIVPYKS